MTTEEIVARYQATESLRETAYAAKLSRQKVRRILITAGVWSSSRTDDIHRLMGEGKSTREIASELDMTENAVISYLPYTKGIYGADEPTENALAIRRWREKHKSK